MEKENTEKKTKKWMLIALIIAVTLVIALGVYVLINQLSRSQDEPQEEKPDEKPEKEEILFTDIEEFLEALWMYDIICVREAIPTFNNISEADPRWIGAVALDQIYKRENLDVASIELINEYVKHIFGLEDFFVLSEEVREERYGTAFYDFGYFLCYDENDCYHGGHGGDPIIPFRLVENITRQGDQYIVDMFVNMRDMSYWRYNSPADQLSSDSPECRAKLGTRIPPVEGYSGEWPDTSCAGAQRIINGNWYYFGEGEDLKAHILENPAAFPRMRLTIDIREDNSLRIVSSVRI